MGSSPIVGFLHTPDEQQCLNCRRCALESSAQRFIG